MSSSPMLKTINRFAPRTEYFRCANTEYEEVYDWLVRASGPEEFSSYYLIRIIDIGWVRFEDTKMVDEFLKENSF